MYGPRRRKGLQRRGQKHRDLRQVTANCTIRLEIPVSLRHDDAHHDLRRNLGYVPHNHNGRLVRRQKDDNSRRYPGLHPVCEIFHSAIAQIANIMNIFQQTAAAAERVFEFLEEEEGSPRPTSVKGVEQFMATSSSRTSDSATTRRRYNKRLLLRSRRRTTT